MKLEGLEVELRPRSMWEGVDLGLAMLQRWRGPVFAAWLATAGVVALGIGIGFADYPLLWPWLWWWLTPLFERVVVFVLARAMFGATPSVRDVYASLRDIWGRNLLRTLTWRRLTTTRALLQPVELLEGVSGRERRRREREVGASAFATITAVILLCLVFEVVLQAGFCLLVYFFTPSELLPDTAPLLSGDLEAYEAGWTRCALQLISFTSLSLATTMHAAAGFGLYLQRRTELEGWDIEVAFRRIGRRVQRERSSLASRATAVLAAAALTIGLAAPARALRMQSEPAPVLGAEQQHTEDPAEAIERILATPEFSRTSSERRLGFDFGDEQPERRRNWRLPLIGPLLQAIAWTVAAVLALALVAAVVLGLKRASHRVESERRPATHAFGLDIRPESLPADVPSEALALWKRGEARAALGLLYRAALAALVRDEGLELDPSDTENDCLRRARRLPKPERAVFFEAVTRAWMLCAYARSRPSDEVFEALCGAWPSHFARGAA